MDGRCIEKLNAIDLFVLVYTEEDYSSNFVHSSQTELVDYTFIDKKLIQFDSLNPKIKNNKFIFTISFYILKDTNIQCIIGRDTIKKHSLASKF
jgi:hypothetical protein